MTQGGAIITTGNHCFAVSCFKLAIQHSSFLFSFGRSPVLKPLAHIGGIPGCGCMPTCYLLALTHE